LLPLDIHALYLLQPLYHIDYGSVSTAPLRVAHAVMSCFRDISTSLFAAGLPASAPAVSTTAQ
jgi:hypothetical protein